MIQQIFLCDNQDRICVQLQLWYLQKFRLLWILVEFQFLVGKIAVHSKLEIFINQGSADEQ